MKDIGTDELKKLQQEGLAELIQIISQIEDEKFLAECFECLFTPPELEDLGKRWLLVKELSKGTPQREIAQKFRMSLCKITRGSKELKKEDSAFRKMLEMI
ncbi:MAG: transcriptional regulator [Treponema sp.]|nr:transcriptional regulator [Treponema sp.]